MLYYVSHVYFYLYFLLIDNLISISIGHSDIPRWFPTPPPPPFFLFTLFNPERRYKLGQELDLDAALVLQRLR